MYNNNGHHNNNQRQIPKGNNNFKSNYLSGRSYNVSSRTTPHSSENKIFSLGFKNLYKNSISPIRSDSHTLMNDTQRSGRASLLFSGDENLNELKCQLISQGSVLREYENWVNILINILHAKEDKDNHLDCATPVQKSLERIDNLESENFELIKKLYREVRKNKDKSNLIKELKSELELFTMDFNENNEEKIHAEKKQLMESIHAITEELDDLSEKNKASIDEINSKKGLVGINKLLNEIELLKEEQKELKEIEKFDKAKKSQKFQKGQNKTEKNGKKFMNPHSFYFINLSSKNESSPTITPQSSNNLYKISNKDK